jgi:hypothetical protein
MEYALTGAIFEPVPQDLNKNTRLFVRNCDRAARTFFQKGTLMMEMALAVAVAYRWR